MCSYCSGGGGVMATVGGGCGSGSLQTALPGGGGGGGGHTSDLVSGEIRSASPAPVLGARVPVGRPRGPIWIRVVYLYASRGGVQSGTNMTLIGSSSSSSSTTMTSTTSS
jgi:hypothetical protein